MFKLYNLKVFFGANAKIYTTSNITYINIKLATQQLMMLKMPSFQFFKV